MEIDRSLPDWSLFKLPPAHRTEMEQLLNELETELPELLAKKAENERYHRAIAAERWQEICALPMTPERKVFYDLHEKNRKLLGIDVD